MKPTRIEKDSIENTHEPSRYLKKKYSEDDAKKISMFYQDKKYRKLKFEEKVERAKAAVKEYYDHFDGKVMFRYGGGVKSDVALHIFKTMGLDIPAVYLDTGTEYPVIREHALGIANYVHKPNFTFEESIRKYGYPVISAAKSSRLKTFQKNNGAFRITAAVRLCGANLRNTPENEKELAQVIKAEKILNPDFKVSKDCCERIYREGWDRAYYKYKLASIVADTMATNRWVKVRFFEEGKQNIQENYYGVKKEKARDVMHQARCYMFATWSRPDFAKYIATYNVPYCKEHYGEIIETKSTIIYGKDYAFTKSIRSKCMFCPFYLYRTEPETENVYEYLKHMYPKEYRFLMNGGMYVDGVWQPSSKGLGYAHIMDFASQVCDLPNYQKWLKERG